MPIILPFLCSLSFFWPTYTLLLNLQARKENDYPSRKHWLFKCSTNFTLTSFGTVALPTGTNSATNESNVIGCNPFRRIISLADSCKTLLRHPQSVRLAWRLWWIRSISPVVSSLWRMADSICCCCLCCCPSWGHGLKLLVVDRWCIMVWGNGRK